MLMFDDLHVIANVYTSGTYNPLDSLLLPMQDHTVNGTGRIHSLSLYLWVL